MATETKVSRNRLFRRHAYDKRKASEHYGKSVPRKPREDDLPFTDDPTELALRDILQRLDKEGKLEVPRKPKPGTLSLKK